MHVGEQPSWGNLQKDLQNKPPPLHSHLGKLPEEPTATAICHSQPSGPLASRRLVQQSPSEPGPGLEAGQGAVLTGGGK